jgi:2-polyprenyl-3-methyl-5-hydroxy-6-metoxy-1,4-benzoquinol methylase
MEFTGERFIPERLKKSDETYQEHFYRYLFSCDYIKDSLVLDAACGVGFGARMMSKYAKNIYAIDISLESINYAKEKYFSTNVIYEQMDVRQILYPDSFFDVVVSFETIEHIYNPEKFIKEVQRVLKPGGLFIISTPNRETTSKGKEVHTPFHIKEFTLEEIMLLLSGFESAEIFAQKMTYHRRVYKKLRLLSRYIKGNLRQTLSRWIERYPP